MNDYPKDIAELDLDDITFPPAAIEAGKRLARSRPWRGSLEERKQKLLRFVADLAAAHDASVPQVIFDLRPDNSDGSYYSVLSKTIVLRGKNLSVITLSHEAYHHILGESEHYVCRASLGLFKRCFPSSWERLRFDGHLARRTRERDE